MIIGCGYNCAFEIEEGRSHVLKIPQVVSFLEMGISEFCRIGFDSPVAKNHLSLSLHLARPSICEESSTQRAYISHIQKLLKQINPIIFSKIISIGLHLTGSRFSGNGLLGGADVYIPTADNLKRVISFVRDLRSAIELEIWLENASLYNRNVVETLKSWEHVREICQRTNCKAIVDLAHIVIDANNVGISPEIILGTVPWCHVAEFHLSGIKRALDGSMHDGHNYPVSDKVWDLLRFSLPLLPSNFLISTIFTIEHTPPSWVTKEEEFFGDFDRLENIIASIATKKYFAESQEKYMLGYLKYLLSGQIPLLLKACDQRGVDFSELLNRWLTHLRIEGKRIIFDTLEVPEEEIPVSAVLTDEFLIFAKNELDGIASLN